MRRNHRMFAVVATAVMLGAVVVGAQRGGGGAPRGGGGAFPLSRLESLEENFKLTADQKKAVKTALDEAQRSAAPARDGLLKAHAALGDAVQTGKPQDEIDAAAKSYAEQAAAMARTEMDAVAKVIGIADPELHNPQAIQAAFLMARGMFLKNSKWDEIPERNVPSY